MSSQLSLRVLGATVLIWAGLLTAKPEMPGGGLVGSKHDFTQYGWSSDQLCLPCHTPQSADKAQLAPRWQPAEEPGKRYTLYGSQARNPGTGSLVCLGCHDGSTAVDSYGGMSVDPTLRFSIVDRAIVARNADLSGDHPIGVTYPDFDRGYKSRFLIEAEGYVALPQGRVECISCHDVHNQYGLEDFLVRSNERSALCLSCHQK